MQGVRYYSIEHSEVRCEALQICTVRRLSDSSRLVLTERRDTGTFPLRRAARPSMARSGADVLSAHGLRGKVPVSRLALVASCKIQDAAHWSCTLQQHGLGKASGTVSRQGCRRPSDTWMCLKRVPEALPNP